MSCGPQLASLRVRILWTFGRGIQVKRACLQHVATRNWSLVGRVSQIPRLVGLLRLHSWETREATSFTAASSFLFLFHTRLPPAPLHFLSSISDAHHLSVRNQFLLITTARRSWFDYWLPFLFLLPGAATLELSTLRISW